LTQHTVSEIETGKQEPRPSTLKKLADALGAAVGDLFGEASTPDPPPRSVGQQLRDNPEDPVNLLESWRYEQGQGSERPLLLAVLSQLDNKLRKAPPGERLYLIDRLLDEESSETNRHWLRSRRERVLNGTYRPMRPDPQTPVEAGREAQELVTT
jgi:transcriptional regulator with XRE-family HTH domain